MTLFILIPEGNTLPNHNDEVKKIFCLVGMEYKKIHTCPYDCILYQNEFKDLNKCARCGLSHCRVKDIDSYSDESTTRPHTNVL